MEKIDRIQDVLEFEGWGAHEQFAGNTGLGRVGFTGFCLGVIFGAHVSFLVLSLFATLPFEGMCIQWSLYVTFLTGFHFSEFFVTALYKPDVAGYNSFVVNHSKAYTIASLACWAEFWLETLLLPPTIKRQSGIMALGLVLVIMGQYFRAAAMWTARSNFNHIIMEVREAEHKLVTHGVYKYLRHPSYFGWFWWCVGLQLLLCNPICTVAFFYAAWDFFQKRIPHEEATLLRFYPSEYPAYMARTRIGIPFVKGIGDRPLDSASRSRKQD